MNGECISAIVARPNVFKDLSIRTHAGEQRPNLISLKLGGKVEAVGADKVFVHGLSVTHRQGIMQGISASGFPCATGSILLRLKHGKENIRG